MARILTFKLLPKWDSLIEATKTAPEFGDKLTLTVGREVAIQIKNLIREPLAKHPKGIGASGRSFSSVKIRKGSKKGKGHQEWIVFETGGGANTKIRHGIPAGQKPSFAGLRAWASAKSIDLRHPDHYKDKRWSTAHERSEQERERDSIPVRYISAKQKRRIRPYKKDEDKFTAAIHAIGKALEREGTNRPPGEKTMGAAWWPLYPGGQGRFDYVSFAVRRRRPAIRRMISDAGDDVKAGLLSHILSGRGRSGFSKDIKIGSYMRG